MKLHRILLLLLSVALLFSVVACASTPEEEAEELRKDLAALEDEALIDALVKSYENYKEPAVFAAEFSEVMTIADAKILEMKGIVRSTGVDSMMNYTAKIAGVTAESSLVYTNGILYMNVAGTKLKYATKGDNTLAQDEIQENYPEFLNLKEGNFAKRDLLRSDNGTYTVVFSQSSLSVEDLDLPSSEGVEFTGFSDLYLTLSFSSEGKLMGQTFGMDLQMTADGIETTGSFVVKFLITSTDPVQTLISAPEDGDKYQLLEELPEESTDKEQNQTSSEEEDAETENRE